MDKLEQDIHGFVCMPITELRNKAYQAGKEGTDDKEMLADLEKIEDNLLRFISDLLREARISELEAFEPFVSDHSNCPLPLTCTGYQNAQSDFDNEREIRIKELRNE